jgi:hypothetical protein
LAFRTLKLDGHLHIFDSTSRFTDRSQFVKTLKELGFGGIEVEDKWKFTHIHARKTAWLRVGCMLAWTREAISDSGTAPNAVPGDRESTMALALSASPERIKRLRSFSRARARRLDTVPSG